MTMKFISDAFEAESLFKGLFNIHMLAIRVYWLKAIMQHFVIIVKRYL